jgi:hypothetical protein
MKSDAQNQDGATPAPNKWLGGDPRFHELMHNLRAATIGKGVSASEWQEIKTFIEENIRPEGVVNQEEWDKGHKAGVASARAGIKTWLINKATDDFKAGKDEDAKRLRELANSINC